MKKCLRCHVLKDLSAFGLHKQRHDGLRAECKECTVELNRANYLKHVEARRADARVRMAEWRAIPGNSERNRLAAKEWSHKPENGAVARARTRAWSKANPDRKVMADKAWRKNNPGLVAHLSKTYKTKKRSAAPVWRNDFLIEEAYRLAAFRSKLTGTQWHVDHIVPLQGRLVSGLHVESNLSVITARENGVKGNRYWPDMP